MTVYTDITDTSVYQGDFDVVNTDVHGIICKLTQGNWRVDPQAARTFNLARSKPFRWVGLYHFLDGTNGHEQYSHFAEQLERLGVSTRALPPGVGVAVDWESNAITGEPLPPIDTLRWFLDFLCADDAIEHHRVAIYSYLSAITQLPDDLRQAHPIWLAYPGDLHVPVDEDATLWQWGIETNLPGIAPRAALCDSVINWERTDAWFGVPEVFPQQKELPMFMMQGPNGIGDGVFLLEAQTIRWIDDPAEMHVLNQAGVPMVTDSLDAIRMMREKRIPFGPSPTSGGLMDLW